MMADPVAVTGGGGAVGALTCGLALGVGAAGLSWAWWGDRGVPGWRRRPAQTARRPVLVWLAATAGGVVAWLVTGWPVALPIGAVAVVGLPRLFRRLSGSMAIARLEAVATWTEMLQGTLAASAGLGQAIAATAPLAPAHVRPAATRLSARIAAGGQPDGALLQFADELADPCADRVVCALLLATTARAQKLGDLLAELAESTRQEVALRMRVETSRASVRSGVRTVLVFSVAFAAGLAVLARSYLAPLATPRGQLVVCVVAALYASGLTLLVVMARPPAVVRLLGPSVELS
jgi:tight adherence protein B